MIKQQNEINEIWEESFGDKPHFVERCIIIDLPFTPNVNAECIYTSNFWAGDSIADRGQFSVEKVYKVLRVIPYNKKFILILSYLGYRGQYQPPLFDKI